MGLGLALVLAIVNCIVKLHAGQVEVASVPGQGTIGLTCVIGVPQLR